MISPILRKLRAYHFEWKHFLILFIVLIFFQIIVSYIQKISLQEIVSSTQNWYQEDSAEMIANLTATALELLMETNGLKTIEDEAEKQRLVGSFNILLAQGSLQNNIDEILLFIHFGNQIYAIKDGNLLFDLLYLQKTIPQPGDSSVHEARKIYMELLPDIRQHNQIINFKAGQNDYRVFVPLIPNGEYLGVLYIKIRHDLSFLSRRLISTYDETALIFSALILFGLMAMFFISPCTVRERDEAQKELYDERENHLRQEIHHQKESLFTKRIYHTHHKAEKIMGFIKNDLSLINPDNLEQVKTRMHKYANFVSRVIYDMKSYDPPLHTIRNQIFKTRINEVIEFIIEAIFKRVSVRIQNIDFVVDLDPDFPVIAINEYVIWEIIEPLIQNCIEHSRVAQVRITITTRFDQASGAGTLTIRDDGQGFAESLLMPDERGIKKIFLEQTSTKPDNQNSGYGCYLAFEIAQRCGWELDAYNDPQGGAVYHLQILKPVR